MLLGLAVKEAVGAGAGGGGGGGGGGAFLPQALTIRTTANAIVILLHSLGVRFNSSPPFQCESTRSSS
jgi:hypothetical protein